MHIRPSCLVAMKIGAWRGWWALALVLCLQVWVQVSMESSYITFVLKARSADGKQTGICLCIPGTGAYICIRKIGSSEPAVVITLWFHTAAVILCTGPVAFGYPQASVWPSKSQKMFKQHKWRICCCANEIRISAHTFQQMFFRSHWVRVVNWCCATHEVAFPTGLYRHTIQC